jgi:hypothetical protein
MGVTSKLEVAVPQVCKPSPEERERSRRWFLNYVNGFVPTVLEELRAQVLPVFDAAQPARYASALRHWCQRWGMADEWINRFAVDTLTHWREAGITEGERLCWHFLPDAIPTPTAPSRRGKRRARDEWDDFTFRYKVVGNVKRLPKAELDRFAKWQRKRGLDNATRQRRHRPSNESEHFKWLAIYHLRWRPLEWERQGIKLTQNSLAAAVGVKGRGLRDALRKAAALIGFTPTRLPQSPKPRAHSRTHPTDRKAVRKTLQ